jgi:hypothetical protein
VTAAEVDAIDAAIPDLLDGRCLTRAELVARADPLRGVAEADRVGSFLGAEGSVRSA